MAFNLNDANLRPIFKGIQLSFSGCTFKNNENYAGLSFLYTYGLNFSFTNNEYSSNSVRETPTLFMLSSTTTSIAHIIHTTGTEYSSNQATILFSNNTMKNNIGLLFSFSDSQGKLPSIIMRDLYLDSHFVNKSSIIYIGNLNYVVFNNITMVNSKSKLGVLSLYTVYHSSFLNLKLYNCYAEQSACFYANNLRNVSFTNINCFSMKLISSYYFSITIEVPSFSRTQPTSPIIIANSLLVVFSNVYFSENSLAHNGIFTLMTTMTIKNFTVTNCYSTHDWPSGLYVTSDSTITIIKAAFYNITCSVCKGSIFIVKQQLNLTDCSFINVTSALGLIYSEDSIVHITGNKFINNTAYYQDSTILGKGGVITISTSEFLNNTSLNEDTLSFLSSQVSISDSSFIHNKVSYKTKGILFNECPSVSIDNCIFIDYQQAYVNIVSGFIYSIESVVNISKSTFNGSIGSYGAIYVKGDSTYLKIESSKFLNNVATIDAPGIWAACNTYIYTSLFDNNSVSGSSFKAGHVLIESINLFFVQDANFSNFSANALYLSNIKTVSIINSIFIGNSSISENRGIYFLDCLDVFINSSVFKTLVSQSSGAGFYLTDSGNNNISLLISYTMFLNNEALNGGGLAIILGDSSFLTNNLKNATFSNNLAQNDGAGFYYNSQNVSSLFNLTNCTISKNTAILAGGGFRFLGMTVTYDNTSHIYNNTAYYGPNIAAYPIHMKQRVLKSPDEYNWYITLQSTSSARILLNLATSLNTSIINETLINVQSNSSNISNASLTNQSILEESMAEIANNPSFNLPSSVPSTISNNLVSGQIQVPPMIFDLIDYYGQIVGTHNSSTLTVNAIDVSALSKFKSNNEFTAINGTYILYPFNLHSPLGSKISLNLTTDALTNIKGMTYPTNFSLQSEYIFSSYLRFCSRNEYLTDDKECWPCKTGYFNLGYPSLSCTACDSSTTRCYGGDFAGPQPGFWRLNGYSLNVFACKTYSSCLGSNVSIISSNAYCEESLWADPKFCVNGWCGKGYQGVYCYDCVDGWAHSNDSCVPCTDNGSYYAITVLIMIAAIIYIIFTIKKALAGKKDEKSKSNKAAILMKILTNYLQLVSIVSSFDFKWSEDTSNVMGGQSQASEATGQIFNFDCVLKSLGTQNIGLRSFFLKLTFIAIFPVLAYFICKLVWFIIYSKRHRKTVWKHLVEMNNRVTTSIVVIMFMIHPNIVKTSIYGFRCKNLSNLSNPVYFLDQDYEMQCWESTHLKWVLFLALPSLILWGFGIPMLALFHIRRNLEKFQDFEFKKAFGFLYDGYKLDRYFWEFVILYRKITMVFILVFLVTYSLATQALAILAVCFLSYLIHIKSQPFIDPELNDAEKKSLINSSFTIYIGLYYISGNLPKAVDVLLLILLVLVNANFVLIWLKAFLSEHIKAMKKAGTWDKILNKFKKKTKENQIIPIESHDEKSVAHENDEKYNRSLSPKGESMALGVEENIKFMEDPFSKNGNSSGMKSFVQQEDLEKKDTKDFK